MKFSWLLLLFLINLFHNVFADQIFTAQTGGAFGRRSHEPKYKIEFHQADSPFYPDDNQESLVMSNKEGKNFICFLPRVEKAKSGELATQQNTSNMIMETEKSIKLKTPDELLEVLKERCFYRQEGWWSYEFCYQKKLRQLHLENDKVLQEFVLGVFDAEATTAFNQNLSDVSTLKDPRSKDASLKYHAHQYTNGTVCDLTNQPRETEVRFVCADSRVMISSITEISTCRYALTLQSPMLCKHPMFQEERPVWHTIDCNEFSKVTGEDQLDKETIERSSSMKDDERTTIVPDMIKAISNYDDDSEHYAT